MEALGHPERRSSMRRNALVLGAVLAACVAVVAPSALAGTPPIDSIGSAPSLEGERFGAPFETHSGHVTCGPHDSGKITFDVEGTATGPYPGRFRESGILRVDDQGHTKSFFAKFKILTSGPAMVPAEIVGTKSEPHGFYGPINPVTSEPNDESDNQLVCEHQYSGSDLGVGRFDNADYTAHIDTLDRKFHDCGKSSADLVVLKSSATDDQIYEIFSSKYGMDAKPGW
jgi:hypothetical protein